MTRCLQLGLTQHGVFTLQQALDVGATKDALYRACLTGKIKRYLPRVYSVEGSAPAWQQKLMGLCLWSEGYASHRSAAALWRLDGCRPGPLEVVTHTRRKQIDPSAKVHKVEEIPTCDVATVDGIPATTPSRTLLDLAAVVDEANLELAFEDALRRGLTSMARLEWQLSRMGRRGKSGTGRLRSLMEQRSEEKRATESALETRFARWLRGTSLPRPERQVVVKGKQRSVRVDFAYPAEKVALEVDGFRFHSGRSQWYRDRAKTQMLQGLGWTVISVAAEDIARGGDLEQRIARALGLSLL